MMSSESGGVAISVLFASLGFHFGKELNCHRTIEFKAFIRQNPQRNLAKRSAEINGTSASNLDGCGMDVDEA
jgi:hypothetical protein